MRRVVVGLAASPYEVVVGEGVVTQVGALLAGRRRAAVVSQSTVADHWAAPVLAALGDAGVEAALFPIDDGEAAKSLATVEDLARRFAAWGLLRDDAVVALGGGVVGDTAGFTAAVYHRGIAVVQVPTTLLGQVDAAIGGKTAVNLPEGKNLVGAFHQPLGVLADVGTLRTLPERDFRAGLGEVAKYALMGDEVLAGALHDDAAALTARDLGVLEDVVARCAATKAAVVVADERERSGRRATLNYGHTLAHALETTGGYDLLHGEAVAIGLVFAAQLEEALERVPPGTAKRAVELLAGLGLPVQVPDDLDADEVRSVMARDKKAAGALTFVLRGGDTGPEVVDAPDPAAVAKALAAVGVGD